MFLIYAAVFLIIRSAFRSDGGGGFLSTVALSLSLGSFYQGMWVYSVALMMLAFAFAGGGRYRKA